MPKTQKIIQFALIIIALCFLTYNVFVLKASFFYLLYLYWFDECIRTVGVWVRVRSTKFIADVEEKDKKIIVNGEEKPLTPAMSVNLRIFFLFLYFVFIVFGFGFMLTLFSDVDNLGANISVFMFQNMGFNINVGIFLLREIVSYLYDFVIYKRFNAQHLMPFPETIDKRTLVLHLSIILGGGTWVLSQHDLLFGIDLTTGKYGYVLIIPFVVIRFIVEIVLFLKKEKNTA